MKNIQYATRVKLLKLYTHSPYHKVLHHIIPPKEGTRKKPSMDEEKELWSNFDVMVVRWIYEKISYDLLHMIIERDTITMEA